MLWVLSSHLPTIDGYYTSPIATLLKSYRTVDILRRAQEVASYQAARPPHIFEHHPPKNGNDDNHLVSLDAYGEKAAGTMLNQVEGFAARKAYIDIANPIWRYRMITAKMQTLKHLVFLLGHSR